MTHTRTGENSRRWPRGSRHQIRESALTLAILGQLQLREEKYLFGDVRA